MNFEHCTVATEGRVLIVTINRPERMNALHPPANAELAQVFDGFAADPDLWVAILTGAGERAFSAGNDLRWQAEGNAVTVPATGFAGLTSRWDLDKPVIAAVNGVAMGGGFEIALACDLILAADTAKFALPEPKVGLAALAGGLHRLPRAIGQALAFSDDAHAHPALRQLRDFLRDILLEQRHQRRDLRGRTLPVLLREGEQRQVLHTGFDRAMHDLAHRLHPGTMAERTRHEMLARPAAVAIHDDGNVLWRCTRQPHLLEQVGSGDGGGRGHGRAQTSINSASFTLTACSIFAMKSSCSFCRSFSAAFTSSSDTLFSFFSLSRASVRA